MFKSLLSGCAIAIPALLIHVPVLAGPNDSAWIQLFNKADTSLSTNWDIHIQGSALNVDTKNTFRRSIIGSDTVLEVSYSNYNNNFTFGHIGYKIRPFNYYIVRVEHQFVGTTQAAPSPGTWALQNNGIMHHSQSIASMGVSQNFPVSLEAQLLGPSNTGADNNSTLNLCTPGTSYYTVATGGTRNDTHCNTALTHDRSATLAPNWAVATVHALSDSIIRYYYRDTLVFTFYRPVQYNGDNQVTGLASGYTVTTGTAIKGGYILLQSESAPTRFRKVELLNLEGCMTTTDANYKSYLVKHDPTACAGSTGIKGQSERDARDAISLAFVKNSVRIGGSGKVTLEVYDTKGVLTAQVSGTAPMQWEIPVRASGMHMVKVITAKGSYTDKATLF